LARFEGCIYYPCPLYGHADEQFYLREIARRAGTGIGATQRGLGQLTDAGLIHRARRGHQVYYQADKENPIFFKLKSILAKTSGIRDVLKEVLAPLADRVRLAFVCVRIDCTWGRGRGERRGSHGRRRGKFRGCGIRPQR
jgi:hypothetical protein